MPHGVLSGRIVHLNDSGSTRTYGCFDDRIVDNRKGSGLYRTEPDFIDRTEVLAQDQHLGARCAGRRLESFNVGSKGLCLQALRQEAKHQRGVEFHFMQIELFNDKYTHLSVKCIENATDVWTQGLSHWKNYMRGRSFV